MNALSGLRIYSSSFKLLLRWLRSFTPVTYCMYAPEDSLSCRLEATRMILSKGVICRPDKMRMHRHQAKHYSS
ncbi:hypothetical protein FDX09_04570 [Citrobacter sp. wls717]|nr:hypothetical protein FDX09_04570 [Citrobacter sp. wls717]TKU81173.1 hypothetical protein FDX13_20290 [Citrobacter sp. wls707]